MKVIKGDLIQLALDGKFDVIIHGCNCQCTMGAGIAKQIKEVFPEAYLIDRATKNVKSHDKLGLISSISVTKNDHHIIIVNGYTQLRPGGHGVLVDYKAITKVMRKIKTQFSGKRIGYPKIGAGLARGNWDRISKIIDCELQGEDHTLVEFVPI